MLRPATNVTNFIFTLDPYITCKYYSFSKAYFKASTLLYVCMNYICCAVAFINALLLNLIFA